MPPESTLHATVRRICAERGIQPADTLDEAPLTRRAFAAHQLAAVIHHRWGGRYDDARPVPRVAAWIDRHLADPTGHPTLALSGDTGTGKTWNAVAALRTIVTEQPGLCWQMTTHADLGDRLRPKGDNSHEYALDAYLDTGLLVLDDLGAGLSTAWTTDCIQRLIDRRWTRRLATIYTTNLDVDGLRAAMGDRVVSRLGDATHIHLDGNDRRWTP